jgi:hypothetical protein
MRSRSEVGVTPRPGRASAHSRSRANSTTGPLRFFAASACGFESVCHLSQRRAQAAGGVKQDRFFCHRRRRHDRENRERYRKPCGHHAPESLALG